MSTVRQWTELGIRDLPDVVNALITRATGRGAALRLHLTYLRRKAGRGLVAVYRVEEPEAVSPFVHLAVDEHSLEGMRISFPRERLEQGKPLSGSWPGIVEDDELGITLQAFPADADLPALATVCNPAPGTSLAAGLAGALAELVQGEPLAVTAAVAEPIRYKPGDRCVLRYRLELDDGGRSSVVGKVYADAAHAAKIYRLTERLHSEQSADEGLPLLPRPLRLLEDFGLILSEDLATGGPITAGTTLFGASASRAEVPTKPLCAAAAALARLHTGAVRPEGVRSGHFEASRAKQRADRLGDFVPSEAERAVRLAGRLEEQLRRNEPPRYAPAHGSFKAAQLVFQAGGGVFLTDFDQCCLADPALDVGYFRAYLRPASLWYERPGARAWFDAATRRFLDGYRQAMVGLGWDGAEVDAIAVRSRAYEAALLFKIANRRPNRLQSPRLGELAAVLAEIERCLAREDGG